MEGAAGNDAVWAQITPLLSQIAALAAQEQKRRVEISGLMRTEKVAELAREILLIVRSEVTDPVVWARVQDRLTAVIGAPQYAAIVEADDARGRAEC